MLTPQTPDDPQPVQLQPGQETVIRFVLNGPLYAEPSPAAEPVHAAPPQDVTDLRRRVAELERALVNAETQLQALARAIGAVFPSSATFVDRAARPMPSAPPAAHDGAWTMGAFGDGASTAANGSGSGGTLAAAAAAASSRYREPDLLPVAAAETATAARSAAPKVNGLRRMISVLKHNN